MQTESSVSLDASRTLTEIYKRGDPTMRVHTQPVERQRLRYEKDGIRYLKGSRNEPMCIEVVDFFCI